MNKVNNNYAENLQENGVTWFVGFGSSLRIYKIPIR